MKLTISNKYIKRRNCSYFDSSKLCPFHIIIRDSGSENLEVLHKTISIIQKHFCNPVPKFLKSFDELSSWRTLKNIKLVFCIIWLVDACINWITDGKDEEYDELKLTKLQLEIFNNLPEGKFNIDAGKVLRDQLKLFLEKYHLCQCEYRLKFTEKQINKFDIGNRIDLVEKLLKEDGMVVYDNFNSHLEQIVKRIRDEIRKVKYTIGKEKELCQIPKNLWTEIFKKYVSNSSKSIYIDSGDKLFDLHSGDDSLEEDTESEEEKPKPKRKIKTKYIYLHVEETNPGIICKISFKNQSYCVLCDGHKPNISMPIVHVSGECSFNTDITGSKPYICTNVCTPLIHYYNSVILKTKKDTYKLNFDNFRYAKNRMMEFYTGCADDKSDLSILYNGDVKKYIVSMFLVLLVST
jgi:hypothetical protein